MAPITRRSLNVGSGQSLLTDPHLLLRVVFIVEYKMMSSQMDCPLGSVSRLRAKHPFDLFEAIIVSNLFAIVNAGSCLGDTD